MRGKSFPWIECRGWRFNDKADPASRVEPLVKPSKGSAMKPKIKASSVKWLNAIDEYIRRYNLRGRIVSHAASDVLDGWATRDELTDLIKSGLLRVIRFSQERDDNCGTSWTVGLTEKAIRVFWPDRYVAEPV